MNGFCNPTWEFVETVSENFPTHIFLRTFFYCFVESREEEIWMRALGVKQKSVSWIGAKKCNFIIVGKKKMFIGRKNVCFVPKSFRVNHSHISAVKWKARNGRLGKLCHDMFYGRLYESNRCTGESVRQFLRILFWNSKASEAETFFIKKRTTQHDQINFRSTSSASNEILSNFSVLSLISLIDSLQFVSLQVILIADYNNSEDNWKDLR